MKKIITLIVVLLVLVAAGVWYYQTSKSNPVSTNPPQNEIAATGQPILLYPLSGDVTFKATPNDDFQNATTSPTIIPNQAIVHTGIGKASVLLPDNSSISLENNTEITVNYSEKSISIFQTLGTTYHRVQTLLSGKTYQVQTAGTLAAVRGTKFAVKYDDKTKKTKIAVTENKVQVSTTPTAIGTTTPPAPETVMVEAGKTISVAMVTKEQRIVPSMTPIVDTSSDKEMNIYVETQKKLDVELDTIKKESATPEEFRKEMRQKMFNDNGDESSNDNKDNTQNKEDSNNKPAPEDTTKTKTEEVPAVKEDTTKPTTNEAAKPAATDTALVVKMGDEEFFNAFEPLFIKYFYLDDQNSACNVTATPSDRVQIVTSFAIKNGHPFTSATLPSFAQAIDAYCKNKDDVTKAKLQSRFDDEYPFNG